MFRAGFSTPPDHHPSLVREGAKWPLRGFPSLALGIQFRGRAFNSKSYLTHIGSSIHKNMASYAKYDAIRSFQRMPPLQSRSGGTRTRTADLWIGRTGPKLLSFHFKLQNYCSFGLLLAVRTFNNSSAQRVKVRKQIFVFSLRSAGRG